MKRTMVALFVLGLLMSQNGMAQETQKVADSNESRIESINQDSINLADKILNRRANSSSTGSDGMIIKMRKAKRRS